MALLSPGIATNYQAIGPLAGIQADAQFNDWRTQQLAEDERVRIANEQAQHNLEQSRLDDPVNAAIRATKLAQATQDQQVIPEQTQTKLAEAIANKTTAELKTADNRAEYVATTMPTLGDQTPDNFDNSPAAQARWQAFKEGAANVGIKLKSQDWSPEAYQEAKQMQQGALTYRKERQAQEMARLKGGYDIAKATIGASAATTNFMANLSQKQAEVVAKMTPIQKAYFLADQKPVLTSADITQAVQAYQETEVQANPKKWENMRTTTQAEWMNKNPKDRMQAGVELGLPPGKVPTATDIAEATVDKAMQKEAISSIMQHFDGKKVMDDQGNITTIGTGRGKSNSSAVVKEAKTTNPQSTKPATESQKAAADAGVMDILKEYSKNARGWRNNNDGTITIEMNDGSHVTKTITVKKTTTPPVGPPAAAAPNTQAVQQQPRPTPQFQPSDLYGVD